MRLRSAAGLALFVWLLAPLASAQGSLTATPDSYDVRSDTRLVVRNPTTIPVRFDSLRFASTLQRSAMEWQLQYAVYRSGRVDRGNVRCFAFGSQDCFEFSYGYPLFSSVVTPADSVVMTEFQYYCGNCLGQPADGGMDRLWIYSDGSAEPLEVTLRNVYPTATDALPGVSGLRLTLAPNPVREQATFSLTRPTTGEVRAVAYDALGRVVALLHDGPAPEALTLRLDMSAWPPGVYVVRAESDGQSASTRLVVAR